MLRKISCGLLCMAAGFSTSTYSMEINTIQPQGLTVEYDLPPNDPQIFINYMFWAIEVTCKIIANDESDALNIVALAKKGKINDISIYAGQTLQIIVHPDENLNLSADSGAKVEITNLGLNLVKASCTT